MTTLEKLFLQIFERKDWIVEQVQQQADAYTQQLASRLLIDGITPPPWLLNPSFNSRSLNPNELEKEEIISRLLLQPSRDSVPYSSGGFSRYYRPVVAGGNGQLSTEMCMETHAHNQGHNVSNEPPTMLECRNNDTGRSLNRVTEQDDSVNSPQNETDARISSIYAAPDTSLARIQRSKSRQKARELRTSAKTAAKSCLCLENRAHISFSGDSIPKSDIHEITQDKCPSELDNCNHISGANSVAAEGKGDKGNVGTSYSGRPARSGSSYEKPSCLNDNPKTSLSSEKEELDGSILVPPTGKSLEQSGLVNGAMEGIDLPDVSLESYAAKKSITGKTQDTQRQSKLYSGRITRSRSSVQQTSGINKSPKLGKSSSCNPKEGRSALPISVGALTYGLDASNELLDAVETSEVLSDRIGETQAIHSNEGVLKPVISSNIAALRVTRSGSNKEHLLGANHQENVEMVFGNAPMDESVVMQPINSGIKLDQVTLCAESGGLVSRQSFECCMIVKPKQLNFDEMDECELNGICSPLSKKRKLSGLSGQECYPSKDSASSTDHKYNSTFFEQQSPMGMVLSSKSKAARTHPQNNIDECAKDEIMNIRLDKNENPVVEEVEHNSTFSLHHDVDVSCEVDLGHKGEESAVYIPEPENTKSLFISSLTKQVNNDPEDCFDNEERIPEQDLGSIKSKEFEVGMNMKLSNLDMNSAKVGTWPWKLQREVEDQPNCFSDSQGFRVHIRRDAIHCDLEVPENDLRSIGESASVLSSEKIHVSHSNGIQSCDKEVDHGMVCDLPEGTESLHKLQAPEATITEVDDDTSEIPYTLEQSGPSHGLNLIENAADDSTYSLAVDVGAANPASNDEVAVADNMNTERSNTESSLPERMSCLGRDCLFSYGSFQCVRNDDKTAVSSDEIMSVYEGFIIDEQVENAGMENAEGEIDFDTLEIPSTTFARASILEQICKSASTQTPLSQFSSTFKQHQIQDLYGFVADGFLEHMDVGSTMSLEEDSRKHPRASDSHITEVDSAFPKQQNFDLLPFSSTPFCWQSKNHYSSPVGKFWERSASSSGSSEKRLSSNPELTCFPIEEDPSSNEESENAEESDEHQESIIFRVANDVERGSPIEPVEVRFQHPITVSTEMKIERRENDEEVAVEIQEGFVSRIKDDLAEREAPLKSTEVCPQHVNPMSTDMKYSDRCSSYSANKEASLKRKPKNPPGIRVSRYEEENRTSSIATRASSRGNVSLHTEYSKIKSSMRKGIPRLSQKEAKRNNIVSNITSFIPIVQQKQAAAVCPGKRDIKVKALEAAEAAKRREQEKENERKLKKEALKLERARMEKENAREMELNNKKKQEEQKKKEADIAARKRQREEDERKQIAKKRKHVAEARKEQKLQYEKSRAGKAEMEKQHAKNAAIAGNKKGSDNATENPRQNRNADEKSSQRNDTELRTDENLTSVVQQVTSVPENCDASNDCGGKEKATNIVEKSPIKVGSMRLTSQENSYDISPYQCSDVEDEEEDDIPTKKFVPSWASKHRVAMVLPLQQKLDPETIFSVESFCSMDEVLLPRRLQAQ